MKKMLSKIDEEILSVYSNLPFPSVIYKMDGLKYINSLHVMLDGYCHRLLDGTSIKSYVPYKETEDAVEEEFRYAIDRTEGKEKDELIIYRHFYNIVKILIKKYKNMQMDGDVR